MNSEFTFGIIGYGRFGQLWAKSLAPFGRVLVHDRQAVLSNQKNVTKVSLERVTQTDMLFLLVPISEFADCCQAVSPLVPLETIVIDACSVKAYPAKIMQSVFPAGQPLIATHPLFGPDSVKQGSLAGKKIVVSPLQVSARQLNQFESLLRGLSLEIIHATPDDHDRQMARSQALVHFIGRGLEGLHLQKQIIATPDYESLLNMESMVTNDTWQLFLDMQRYNPYTQEVRQKLLRRLQEIERELV